MNEIQQAHEKVFDAARATCEELIRNHTELVKTNEALKVFVHHASHDLQEPLRSIRIFSQLLLNCGQFPSGSDIRKHLEFICSAAADGQELIEDLLRYAEATAPERRPSQRIDLGELLCTVLYAIGPRLREAGATVHSTALPRVWGDASELKRLLINLFTNALKYCREGIPSQIELGAEARGDEFVIAIKDNGIGFDPLDAPEIFKPFKRLKHDIAPGTGLGLAIARAIVERHGGQIWATSDGVVGATFFFTLHRAATEERIFKAYA